MIKKEFIPTYTPKPYGEDSDIVRDLIRRNRPERCYQCIDATVRQELGHPSLRRLENFGYYFESQQKKAS